MTSTSITFSFIHGISVFSNFFQAVYCPNIYGQGREKTFAPSKECLKTLNRNMENMSSSQKTSYLYG